MNVLEKVKRRLRTMFPQSIKHSKCTFGGDARYKKTYVFDNGKDNSVAIGEGVALNRCAFRFYGNCNKVIICKGCKLNDVTFWIEDDGNEIMLGAGTTIHGKTEIACIEGTSVTVGDDCMFSSNISMRTGDSHSVVDLNGKRINPSRNIRIGNHVWIGQDVFIGKGAEIADNSILGAGSVVTRRFDESNVAIAGNPAIVIKEKVNWKRERI